jgi:hypothetical protein
MMAGEADAAGPNGVKEANTAARAAAPNAQRRVGLPDLMFES